jgi:hypothetical protein
VKRNPRTWHWSQSVTKRHAYQLSIRETTFHSPCVRESPSRPWRNARARTCWGCMACHGAAALCVPLVRWARPSHTPATSCTYLTFTRSCPCVVGRQLSTAQALVGRCNAPLTRQSRRSSGSFLAFGYQPLQVSDGLIAPRQLSQHSATVAPVPPAASQTRASRGVHNLSPGHCSAEAFVQRNRPKSCTHTTQVTLMHIFASAAAIHVCVPALPRPASVGADLEATGQLPATPHASALVPEVAAAPAAKRTHTLICTGEAHAGFGHCNGIRLHLDMFCPPPSPGLTPIPDPTPSLRPTPSDGLGGQGLGWVCHPPLLTHTQLRSCATLHRAHHAAAFAAQRRSAHCMPQCSTTQAQQWRSSSESHSAAPHTACRSTCAQPRSPV